MRGSDKTSGSLLSYVVTLDPSFLHSEAESEVEDIDIWNDHRKNGRIVVRT